jgi:predicted transcriptional regulator
MTNSTHREIIEAYVISIPHGKKFTSTSVAEETGVYPEAVSHHFTGLWRDGIISRIGSERVHKR